MIQTTKKQIRANFGTIAIVPEDIWHDVAVALHLVPYAYTVGVYGRNADIYVVGGVAVTVGNRPFGTYYDRDMLTMWRDIARLARTTDEINAITAAIAADMRGEYPLRRHHTSLARGYVSRRGIGYVVPYRGRFGIGIADHTPNWDSNQYHNITYYII
jgi:hypothetical protein|nr:MAG TPA: hypothetical protein [Caudoviricetes sp.]